MRTLIEIEIEFTRFSFGGRRSVKLFAAFHAKAVDGAYSLLDLHNRGEGVMMTPNILQWIV